MNEVDEGSYRASTVATPVERPVAKEVVKPVPVQPKPTIVPQPVKPIAVPVSRPDPAPADDDLKARLEKIEMEDLVYHKKFGKGEVVKINKNEKFIFIKFMLGEKKFIFPDAFLMGFLELL